MASVGQFGGNSFMHAAGRFRRLLSAGIAAATATAALLTLQAAPASADTPAIGWSMHVGPGSPIPDRDNRPYIAAVEQEIGRPLAYDTRYDTFGKDQLIGDREQWAKSVGKIPFIH